MVRFLRCVRGSRHICRALCTVMFVVWCGAGCGANTAQTSTTPQMVDASTTTAPQTYTILTTAPLRPGQSGTPASTGSTVPVTESEPGTSSPTTTTTSSPQTPGTSSTSTPSPATTAKTVVLTVRGAGKTVGLSLAELRALPATVGFGGWKNSLGNITAPREYRGAALQTLLDLVGGGSAVTVVASDGYRQDLSSDELRGLVATYRPNNGEPTDDMDGAVTPVVAYELRGGAVGPQEGGPLRIAFLSPSADQVTDSWLWVKFVSVIEVR